MSLAVVAGLALAMAAHAADKYDFLLETAGNLAPL
jgi:hypothetical protein